MNLKKIRKIFDQLISLMQVSGSALVFMLMAIIVLDVTGRAFFNQPLTGTMEIVKVSLVALFFLGMPKTLQMDKHIRATVLVNRLSGIKEAILNLFCGLCGFTLFVALVYSCWDLAVEAWNTSEFEGAGALQIPTYPLRVLILVCCGLTALQYLRGIIKHLMDINRHSKGLGNGS